MEADALLAAHSDVLWASSLQIDHLVGYDEVLGSVSSVVQAAGDVEAISCNSCLIQRSI